MNITLTKNPRKEQVSFYFFPVYGHINYSVDISSAADKTDPQQVPCKKKDNCRTYLLTYSQTNLQRFSDNKAFLMLSLMLLKCQAEVKHQ